MNYDEQIIEQLNKSIDYLFYFYQQENIKIGEAQKEMLRIRELIGKVRRKIEEQQLQAEQRKKGFVYLKNLKAFVKREDFFKFKMV